MCFGIETKVIYIKNSPLISFFASGWVWSGLPQIPIEQPAWSCKHVLGSGRPAFPWGREREHGAGCGGREGQQPLTAHPGLSTYTRYAISNTISVFHLMQPSFTPFDCPSMLCCVYVLLPFFPLCLWILQNVSLNSSLHNILTSSQAPFSHHCHKHVATDIFIEVYNQILLWSSLVTMSTV